MAFCMNDIVDILVRRGRGQPRPVDPDLDRLRPPVSLRLVVQAEAASWTAAAVPAPGELDNSTAGPRKPSRTRGARSTDSWSRSIERLWLTPRDSILAP